MPGISGVGAPTPHHHRAIETAAITAGTGLAVGGGVALAGKGLAMAGKLGGAAALGGLGAVGVRHGLEAAFGEPGKNIALPAGIMAVIAGTSLLPAHVANAKATGPMAIAMAVGALAGGVAELFT